MNHFRERAHLLENTGNLPAGTKRNGAGIIRASDYIAVPPPANLSAQPAGNCLVWVWKLNRNGYGTATFPSRETLAHRQSFSQSRNTKASDNILHLCHRPFCIQPSHLYSGSHQDNSDDHRLRTKDDIEMALIERKAEIASRVAKYRWEDTPTQGNTLVDPREEAVEHQCAYSIPAGDTKICFVCGRDEAGRFPEYDEEPNWQPQDTDRNQTTITSEKRIFRDLGPDMPEVTMNARMTMTLPKTRAERRRRDREAKRSSQEPKLLARGVIDPSDPGPTRIRIDEKIQGPGYLVAGIRRIPKGNSFHMPTKGD